MLPSLAALSAASLTGACGGGHTRAAKAASTEAETETEPADAVEGDGEDAPVVEEHKEEEEPAAPATRRLG